MSGRNSGRGFGLTRRAGRGVSRPAATTQWTPVRKLPAFVNDGGTNAPPPPQRETITNKYTIFIVIAMGHKPNKQPSRPVMIRHMFNILRIGDNTAAILPFEADHAANSICHSMHVPENPNELAIYFPDFQYYMKRYRTKCRITTTVPMWMIKQRIIDQLRTNDYWINPTTIKSKVSERCGFFLYAHPYLSQQSDFRKIINRIIQAQNGTEDDSAYDLIAETFTVMANGIKDSARVLILRAAPSFNGKLQEMMTSIYSATSTEDLGTLSRYKFVPSTSNNTVTDDTFLGLVRAQTMFGKKRFSLQM